MELDNLNVSSKGRITIGYNERMITPLEVSNVIENIITGIKLSIEENASTIAMQKQKEGKPFDEYSYIKERTAKYCKRGGEIERHIRLCDKFRSLESIAASISEYNYISEMVYGIGCKFSLQESSNSVNNKICEDTKTYNMIRKEKQKLRNNRRKKIKEIKEIRINKAPLTGDIWYMRNGNNIKEIVRNDSKLNFMDEGLIDDLIDVAIENVEYEYNYDKNIFRENEYDKENYTLFESQQQYEDKIKNDTKIDFERLDIIQQFLNLNIPKEMEETLDKEQKIKYQKNNNKIKKAIQESRSMIIEIAELKHVEEKNIQTIEMIDKMVHIPIDKKENLKESLKKHREKLRKNIVNKTKKMQKIHQNTGLDKMLSRCEEYESFIKIKNDLDVLSEQKILPDYECDLEIEKQRVICKNEHTIKDDGWQKKYEEAERKIDYYTGIKKKNAKLLELREQVYQFWSTELPKPKIKKRQNNKKLISAQSAVYGNNTQDASEDVEVPNYVRLRESVNGGKNPSPQQSHRNFGNEGIKKEKESEFKEIDD